MFRLKLTTFCLKRRTKPTPDHIREAFALLRLGLNEKSETAESQPGRTVGRADLLSRLVAKVKCEAV